MDSFQKKLLSWEYYLPRKEALRKLIELYQDLQVSYSEFNQSFDKDFLIIFNAITLLKTAALQILPNYVKHIHR